MKVYHKPELKITPYISTDAISNDVGTNQELLNSINNNVKSQWLDWQKPICNCHS